MATVEHAVPCARPQVHVSRLTTPELIRTDVREQINAARFPATAIALFRLIRWSEVAP